MSMGHGSGRIIPAQTIRTARAANPHGTPAMWVRDRLSELFTDEDFADWYPTDGRRGLAPAQLALVSVLQFAENLTDRQAAQAVACRIDWKYALGLELDDPGFDYSVLCEFRERMAQGDRADRLLAVMVDHLVAAGLVKGRGRVRTDSTHVLAAVRQLNRAELVAETLRAALEELAVANEEWLAELVTPQWTQRYGRPIRYDRLPKGAKALTEYAEAVGADGMGLLRAVYRPDAPARLRTLARVQLLRQVWVQQYFYNATGQLCWREPKTSRDRQSRRNTPRRSASGDGADGEPVPARVPWSGLEIVSPYDAQARFSHKAGKVAWVGYKDHQTEICDGAGPNVIVHVVTTPAPEQDGGVLGRIHADLAARRLAPAEHLVDAGYLTPEAIDRAAGTYGITMVGPVRLDPRAGEHPGYTKEDFHVDWQARTVTCPQGVTSPPWHPTTGDGRSRLSVLFPRPACRECAVRLQCTGNLDGHGRHITLLPRHLQEIQTRARAEQQTEQWHERYAMRAGAEATVSETVHVHGLRHCRYHGLAKTHVQHVLIAAGANIIRLSECMPPGTVPPRLRRPVSHFQRLCQRLPVVSTG
jgi:transposase